MPSPPRKGETEQSFMARCMEHFYKKEKSVPRDRAGAICNSMWERSKSSSNKKK